MQQTTLISLLLIILLSFQPESARLERANTELRKQIKRKHIIEFQLRRAYEIQMFINELNRNHQNVLPDRGIIDLNNIEDRVRPGNIDHNDLKNKLRKNASRNIQQYNPQMHGYGLIKSLDRNVLP